MRKSAQNIGLDIEFVLNDDPVSISHKNINLNRKLYDSHLFTVKNSKREKEFSFGIDYLTYPSMIISNTENSYIHSMKDLENKKIALEKNYLTNKWIKRDYPNIEIINVKNTIEALKMVDSKKVDAYVGNSAIANFLITHRKYKNLKVAAPSGYGNIKYSFMGPKQWPELTSLLSKGYEKIKPLEHTEIQQKWFTVQTVQKEIDYTLLWQIFGTLAIIFIWIVLWNRKLSQEKDKTQKALLELKQSKEYQIKQQEVILNQSKIADMGEMLANVAHQWRQPLSIISTLATGTKLKKELNNLTEDELIDNMISINNNAQHLSKTIDTFRNFLKENKDFKEVILQDRITVALDIYGTILKNNQINIINEINNYDTIKINLVIGELSQVLGNILNNAKDVLIERNIKDRWVKIDLERNEDTISITIEDNAGGIEDSLINKVFDPYFTTKHSSQGTGLGLHMSYRIVQESLNGKLFVTNTNNGAKFYIEIPLKQSK